MSSWSFTRNEVVRRLYHKKNPDQDKVTHTFLDASGVAYIPATKRDWLCGVMAWDYTLNQERTRCSISEMVDENNFTLCFDLDFNNGPKQPYETRESLLAYNRTMLAVVKKFDPPDEPGVEDRRWLALRSGKWKEHIYYAGLNCNLKRFVTMRLLILEALTKEHGAREAPKNSWEKVFDLAIYRGSLRCPLTAKFSPCNSCKVAVKTEATQKTATAAALKRASSICTNRACHIGRVWDGPDSIYQLEFVLRPDGSEDEETCLYLQRNHEAMLKLCTVWHGNRPLSGWIKPANAVNGTIPLKSKQQTGKVFSLEHDGLPVEEKQQSKAAYSAAVRKMLTTDEVEQNKKLKLHLLDRTDPAHVFLQRLLHEGKLGRYYTELELKATHADKKKGVIMGRVHGSDGWHRYCEFVRRKHSKSSIYLQVSNTATGAAVYIRCWSTQCKHQRSPPYPLTGVEYYTMFPKAQAEVAHPVLQAPPTTPRKRNQENHEQQAKGKGKAEKQATEGKAEKQAIEGKTGNSGMAPARKRVKLSDANLLATLLSNN